MLVADGYLGHHDDPAIVDRLADANAHRVVLSDTDRRRSRVRTETDDGRDLGVVVARDLCDGDVLETEEGDLVVVELAPVEALVLDFTDADVGAIAALTLGHTLGNRHWDLAIRGSRALFPVADTYERMETIVADLLPDGVTVRSETVSPTTFDETGADHAHGHGRGDGDHPHGDEGYVHTHGDDGHVHTHEDGGHTYGHSHGDLSHVHPHSADGDET
ncbi:urease accessory protein UreE [Halegenticoccus soli]|uniref:hypothetical protein n=1 Tax=Halegenticoccus soli TaxID=1985678 RepID=UPI000C6DBB69|nr:hypothetical protein [Halegenticoccus soli]